MGGGLRWAMGSSFALFFVVGCDREIVVGEFDQPRAPLSSGNAGAPSTAGDGDGVGAEVGSGGGSTSLPVLPGSLVFESRFETGDLSEWGESGDTVTSSAGQITVVDQTTHEGDHAALVSTETTGSQLLIDVDGPWLEVLVGFYVRFETLYETQRWAALLIDGLAPDGSRNQLWDMGVNSTFVGDYRIYLWEMPGIPGHDEGPLRRLATSSVPAEQWVHVQVHLRAETDDSGFIRVLADGEQVIEVAGHPAGNGDPLLFRFGSFVYDSDSLPANYALDDVTIHAVEPR